MSEFVFELPPFATEVEVGAEAAGVDHEEGAVNRLVQQLKGKPKIEQFIRSLCAPMSALEQVFIDLVAKFHVDVAEGEQLQMLARIVGQTVIEGLTDPTLRRYVKARIYTNRSSGLGNQLIRISKLVIDDENITVFVHTDGNATVTVRLAGAPTDYDVALVLIQDFLSKAAGVGIRVILEWQGEEDEGMFECESYVPGEGDGLGFADDRLSGEDPVVSTTSIQDGLGDPLHVTDAMDNLPPNYNWSAVLEYVGGEGRTISFRVETTDPYFINKPTPADAFVVYDNYTYVVGPGLTASPGDVHIQIFTDELLTEAYTVADLEAEINAQSSLIQVLIPDTANAARFVTQTDNTYPQQEYYGTLELPPGGELAAASDGST